MWYMVLNLNTLFMILLFFISLYGDSRKYCQVQLVSNYRIFMLNVYERVGILYLQIIGLFEIYYCIFRSIWGYR